jgi:hypothetical protein
MAGYRSAVTREASEALQRLQPRDWTDASPWQASKALSPGKLAKCCKGPNLGDGLMSHHGKGPNLGTGLMRHHSKLAKRCHQGS